MQIQAIVEGDGEVEAVPVLLRRLLMEAGVWADCIENPIHRHRGSLVTESGLRHALDLARRRRRKNAPFGVLVLIDGDDDCPGDLVPDMRRWARQAAADLPCAVVVAEREYEAWFLASIESLRGERHVRHDAEAHPDPERVRDAKGQLGSRLEPDNQYSPVADQAAFSARFSMKDAYARSRSFRKLTSGVGALLCAMGRPPKVWPPAGWAAGSGN